jgi:phosphomannomutase
MTDAPRDALLAKARAWIDGDPDPETRRELASVIDGGDLGELEARVGRPLTFGTAGLRGLVGAGPSRMNRAVVIRNTRALADHLLAHEPDARTRPVVVGFDARHSSRALAEIAVRVLAGASIPVRFFADAVPTPLVAYAVRQLVATAGIVVTASHNPAEYNGYKLYAANGVQVVPPTDAEIERRARDTGPAREVPLSEGEWGQGADSHPVPGSIAERYLAEIDALRPHGTIERSLRIVYSPLHGVGGTLATEALLRAGFSGVTVVPEQAEPDGAFPTVRFPNPEERSTLDLAVALATRDGADLILVNDPDADRLAVAVPTAAGRWVLLTGNQIGVLLMDFVLDHTPATPRPLVVSSIVSSPMLGEIALLHGARSEVTLTGFKWIWTAALALEASEGVRFVFGCEEAIGFSVGRSVRDKDGISAALLFAELAARCHASGTSVLERLEAIHRRSGLWVSVQKSVGRPGAGGLFEIDRAVERLAASPPPELGGHAVCGVIDYRRGAEHRTPWLPASPLILLDLGGGSRALVRPSGTEPKLKIYVDLRGTMPVGSFAEAEENLRRDATLVADGVAAFLGLG